jgi:bifunctional DNase/RNase
MTEVRISAVNALAASPRMAVVLVDDAGRRAFALGVRPPVSEPDRLAVASVERAAEMLTAAGGTVGAVRIEQLHDNAFGGKVLLDTLTGDREVEVRLGDGLSLARRLGCPILMPEDVMACGVNLADQGSSGGA